MKHPRVLAVSCVGIAAAVGCAIASADPPHARHDRPAATAARNASPQRTPPPTGGRTATTAVGHPPTPAPTAVAATPAPVGGAAARVHLDLAAHLARAELRHGPTLVIDHGVPGGAKYTLGGWLTQTGDDHDFAGTSALLIPGTTAKLLLPADTAGPASLAIRARAFAGNGALTVYIAGAVVGRATLPTDGSFGVVRVELTAAQLHAGENTMQLRVASTGSAPGVRQAGIAVDWVKLGPTGQVQDGAPPSPATLVVRDGNATAVAVPDGWTLGWTTEIPAGARLRGSAKGAAGSRVTLVALRDGAAPTTLATVAASPAGSPFDVDLGALAGQVARVDATASGGGPVRLVSAQVVTLDAPPVVAEHHPRNVIIYLVDTLRADKLRPFNPASRVQTPGLGRFVEHATLLTGAHTQENWTKPSVATLLTSLMPWQHHAVTTEAVVPESVNMLPEVLRGHGYFTGCFIANGYASDRFGFRQGWNTWRNYIREGRPTRAQYVAADVLQWLDSRPHDQPFFLYVHVIDPHVPYTPPEHFSDLYDAAPYTGPVNFHGDSELLEKIKSGRIHLDARDRTHLEALYDGEISYHDVHFNAIMDGIASRGLADDTMIIVTADHGEEFWDHGSVGHGHSVYEELLHIPMIVRWPGVTNGPARIDDRVGLVDVMPTVLDALGQPIPEEAAGHSFLPLLRGVSDDAPRATVSGFMDGWRAVAVGRWKLIQRTAERMFVYDLSADAHEQTDLAAGKPITLRWLRGVLGLALSDSDGIPSARPRVRRDVPVQTTTIDAETEAQLRALGYVGSSRR